MITHYALRANHYSQMQKIYIKNVYITKNQSVSLEYVCVIAES